MTEVVTRSEAKALGLTRYFTGKPCKYGHVTERLVSTKACWGCALEASRKWRQENREKRRESSRKWREANPEREREKLRKWREANPERVISSNAKRKASRLQATPRWVTKDQLSEIEDFYLIARMFKTYTGLDYHVDHMVPLRGKTVSGLHVPWNLTVLESSQNISKGNRSWPDMP